MIILDGVVVKKKLCACVLGVDGGRGGFVRGGRHLGYVQVKEAMSSWAALIQRVAQVHQQDRLEDGSQESARELVLMLQPWVGSEEQVRSAARDGKQHRLEAPATNKGGNPAGKVTVKLTPGERDRADKCPV